MNLFTQKTNAPSNEKMRTEFENDINISDQTGSEIIPRTKNPLGVLFLIPMFFVIMVVLFLPIISTSFRSLTSNNVLEVPKFIGLENYIKLFSQDQVFRVALNNTFLNALFITLIVGIATLAVSWLIRLVHKALRYTVVLLFDLISVFVLAGGITFLFSGDSYGFINSLLMELHIISKPVQFLSTYIPQIQLLLMYLILFGPVLSVLTLLKTRRVSAKNRFLRLLFPLEHSLHVYLAGSLPVLLMPICWNTRMATFGFPSTNYAAHTIVEHFVDYGSIRFQVGYASAISMVSLLWMLVFLLVFFMFSCGVMHLAAFLKREVFCVQHPSGTHTAKGKKIAPYILSGAIVLCAMFLLFPLFLVLMNSFKEISELFVIPQNILPKKLNVKNYIDLFSMNIANYHFSKWLLNMFIVPLLPAIFVTAVSGLSAFGVSYFDYKARRILYALILLCFILMSNTFFPDYINSWLINHYLALAFYAAFFSAAPLIGFIYFKSVIEHARQYGRNMITAVSLNCIPVVLITYVMCFINPFVNWLIYNRPSFTIYFFLMQPAGSARLGIDSAAKVILIGITFGFLLVAAVTAMAFFPQKVKKVLQ